MKMTLWAEENLSLATELMFSSIDCRDYNIEHIVIVPDRFSLLAEKKLLEKLPNHILFNVKVTNFSSFTTFLLEKLGRASELVSAGERILILQKAVNRVKDQFVYFKKSASDGVSAFPYSDYMASPKNLSGNVYSLKAELEMQLSRIPSKGRVVSVRDEKRHKFAVLIPDGLDVNAQTKQRYDMDVKVGSDGEIIVCSMRKY